MKEYTKENLLKMDVIDVYKKILEDNNIKKFPNGFWNQQNSYENAIKCTKYMIEEVLGYNDDELRNNLSQQLFAKNKLGGMLALCFNHSIYNAIHSVYPNKFKDWEFKTVPNGYWNNIEKGVEATRWLIEDKLNMTNNELKDKLSCKLFFDNGLGGMLNKCFDGSPYKAINTVYPDIYKEWEFKQVSNRYWRTEGNGIKATKWLIEEKLKLSDEEVRLKLSYRLFIENGLSGMLQYCFNGSPYAAINAVYPNKYKEWEFKNVPQSYWNNKENGIKAAKWLIEEKLKLSDEDLKTQLSTKLFKYNGLSGMLIRCFNGSSYEVVNTLYPNKFKEWEFTQVAKHYWNEENGIKATKWLVEEKLKLSESEIKSKLSRNLFIENGLSGMLQICFNNNTNTAIQKAYGNKYQ